MFFWSWLLQKLVEGQAAGMLERIYFYLVYGKYIVNQMLMSSPPSYSRTILVYIQMVYIDKIRHWVFVRSNSSHTSQLMLEQVNSSPGLEGEGVNGEGCGHDTPIRC